MKFFLKNCSNNKEIMKIYIDELCDLRQQGGITVEPRNNGPKRCEKVSYHGSLPLSFDFIDNNRSWQ